ncbi:LysR substrate-binding domain-containing protein [Actinomycetospora sp. CA-084318]|uniref:LysR substrate-binding domain-containing protein n=1 Tax=Actinomycetospora sp. CA-084318 TaxID=3239892 RepID=UPI003D9814B8
MTSQNRCRRHRSSAPSSRPHPVGHRRPGSPPPRCRPPGAPSRARAPTEADLDIHQGRGAWPKAHAELLHHDSAVVVHGPEHLDRWGPVTGIAELFARPRIQVLGFDDVWQRMSHDVGPGGRSGAAITVDTTVTALELAAAGDASAVVPERFARTAVRAGRVSLALPQSFPMRQAHYLLRPLDSPRPSPRARVFLDWLTRLDEDQPALA